MKKCSSVVWRFFDRIENENQRCFAVLCKLCDTQYKFFGNTTNLRAHLINKHPLQWELSQSGTFDETNFREIRAEDDESTNQSAVTPPKRRKYQRTYKDKNVDVLDTADHDNDDNEESEETYNLVRQLHDSRASDEEWLEEDHLDSSLEQKRIRVFRKIKREPQSPPRRVSKLKHTATPSKFEKSPVIIDNSNVRDEYSVFGEYVANKLRKFKAPRTSGNLQQLITTILWQAEYGAYENADAVKRVLMYASQEPDASHGFDSQIEIGHNEEIMDQRDEEPNQSGAYKNVESEGFVATN